MVGVVPCHGLSLLSDDLWETLLASYVHFPLRDEGQFPGLITLNLSPKAWSVTCAGSKFVTPPPLRQAFNLIDMGQREAFLFRRRKHTWAANRDKILVEPKKILFCEQLRSAEHNDH